MILGLNPHAFENQPDAERKRLLAEYGDEKGARKALVEKYGEMAEHPIVKMSKSSATSSTPTMSWPSTALTPCACMRCSSATLRGRPVEHLLHQGLQALPR